jgi:hypothetical protein
MQRKTQSDSQNVEFDDVFEHVPEFGRYQMMAYFGSCLVILPIGMQLACLVFAMGTPRFHCAVVNSTCPPNKCCDNCTSYTFDGPFTSIVSEVSTCSRADDSHVLDNKRPPNVSGEEAQDRGGGGFGTYTLNLDSPLSVNEMR